MNAMGTRTIVKTRVTFVYRGAGELLLTDAALIWNKSATSYLLYGVINLATEDHVVIPLEDLALVDKYTYFPGGGLRVVNNEGKEFKFSFKHKKDFKAMWDYLQRWRRNTYQFYR